MTVGLSVANLADKWLDMLGGTAFTAIAAMYVQLHIGDPGAVGTANVSSVTTREAVTWAAAASGSKSESNVPTWANWGGTNGEVLTDVSFWDASTAGNFLFSAALNASYTVNTGDTVELSTLTFSFSPLAA